MIVEESLLKVPRKFSHDNDRLTASQLMAHVTFIIVLLTRRFTGESLCG
jgi:hypothetical protein